MFSSALIDDIREISRAGQGDRDDRAGRSSWRYYGVTMFYFRVPFVDVVHRRATTGCC